jgi:hypothetical protein
MWVIKPTDSEKGQSKIQISNHKFKNEREFMKKAFMRHIVILLVILVLSNGAAFAQEVSNVEFSDITVQTPYYEAIMYLVDNHLLSGYPDGTFKPDASLTNGEFAAMVCKAFFPEDFKRAFTQEECLNFMNSQDFMKSKSYDTDSINSPIKLFAVANILGSIKHWTLPYSSDCYNIAYKDWNDIGTQYQDNVFAAISAGYILPSSSDHIDPNEPITRAEFCEMLYQGMIKNPNPTFQLPQVLQGINLVYLDNSTQLYSSPAVSQMKVLPESVLESFKRDGWKLEFVKGYMDQVAGSSYSDAIGITIYNEHTIGICSRYINLQGFNPVNHEFGHYLDYKTGISKTEAMENCIDKETNLLKELTGRDYCAESYKEFFAEAFMEYCYMGSTAFGTKMPLTKALIETALAQLPN